MSRPPSDDPSTYDYSTPSCECDIVMKGGITSGVVYPHAVCEIAKTYRFVNVGGTSAGAIAAALAGAAELGRASAEGGFKALAALPHWISTDNNLFKLFQPQRRTSVYFRVAVAGLGGGLMSGLRIFATALVRFPLTTIVGGGPGVLLIVVAARDGSTLTKVVGIACGVILTLLLLVVALLARFVLGLGWALPRNGFGLCSGGAVKRGPLGRLVAWARGFGTPLTPWLAERLDVVAGAGPESTPLTIGDLGAGGVNLELMTTNLILRRPYKMPWQTREYFFDPDEFRRLFPEPVVSWMEDHPPQPEGSPSKRRQWLLRCELLKPLRPFPAREHLPVVVATRMSLSFPILLSAVPLWMVDMSLDENQQADKEWKKWLRHHPENWQRRLDENTADLPELRPTPERCWFSDGGISSNFPLHFFDSPLPRRPTFAINLRPFHPSHLESKDDEEANVYLPATSAGGFLEWWYRFPAKSGLGQVSAFIQAIVRTMQNRVDEAQMRVPGYRDRVAHVSLSKKQGGMNLDMPAPVITRLTLRGLYAGRKLVERFAQPPPGDDPAALSWASHRWTRYRSALAALQTSLQQFADVYSAGAAECTDQTYEQLGNRDRHAAPDAYRWRKGQREMAEAFTHALVKAAETTTADPELLHKRAPRPEPQARIVPPN